MTDALIKKQIYHPYAFVRGEDTGVEESYREHGLKRYIFNKPGFFQLLDKIDLDHEERMSCMASCIDKEASVYFGAEYVKEQDTVLFGIWAGMYIRWIDQVLSQLVPHPMVDLINVCELTGNRLGFTFTQ